MYIILAHKKPTHPEKLKWFGFYGGCDTVEEAIQLKMDLLKRHPDEKNESPYMDAKIFFLGPEV